MDDWGDSLSSPQERQPNRPLPPANRQAEPDQIFADDERTIFSNVVARAEKAGKPVKLVAVPGRDPNLAPSRFYNLGPHPPQLWPEDVDLTHRLWLQLGARFGARLHHRDIVGVALRRMAADLASDRSGDVEAALAEEIAGSPTELASRSGAILKRP